MRLILRDAIEQRSERQARNTLTKAAPPTGLDAIIRSLRGSLPAGRSWKRHCIPLIRAKTFAVAAAWSY
ncbi:hypothetical protein KCP76_01690 [Salmonella enterica subsp. enterica serovar Weltevreden]|nr:hypothetical protein KCP76_01690 [Salmonella enterica subsp. enterica serovar Weltevreden]